MKKLRLENVSVELGGRPVLHDVSLDIVSGRVHGLIGPNGAGKTTILRVLAGLQATTGGSISIDGKPVEALSALARARLIGYLPQGATAYWPMSVERIVALGRLPHLDPWTYLGRADEKAVEDALGAADVSHLVGRPVTELSGGERARVMIARTLAGEPDFLLADEPTSSLDPHHQLAVMNLLRRRAANGDAVAVVLHDLTLARRFCEEVTIVHEGRVLANGNAAEVMNDASLATAFGIEAVSGDHNGDAYLLPWRLVSSPTSELQP